MLRHRYQTGPGPPVLTGVMREHLASVPGPRSWPEPDSDNDDKHDTDHASAVADITVAMGNARRLAGAAGGLLAADAAGASIVVSALLTKPNGVAWLAAVLIVPVVLIWVAAALFLVLAEEPAAAALGELRRGTGAPADLTAPWRPLGMRSLADLDLDGRVVSLIGAAAVAHTRARRALSAAVTATAAVLLWAAVALAIAAVS